MRIQKTLYATIPNAFIIFKCCKNSQNRKQKKNIQTSSTKTKVEKKN